MFRIRIGLDTDPDPAFEVNADPVIAFEVNTDPDPAFEVNMDRDPDPGFFMTRHYTKFFLLFTLFITICYFDLC
jgi:hypothetical protein